MHCELQVTLRPTSFLPGRNLHELRITFTDSETRETVTEAKMLPLEHLRTQPFLEVLFESALQQFKHHLGQKDHS